MSLFQSFLRTFPKIRAFPNKDNVLILVNKDILEMSLGKEMSLLLTVDLHAPQRRYPFALVASLCSGRLRDSLRMKAVARIIVPPILTAFTTCRRWWRWWRRRQRCRHRTSTAKSGKKSNPPAFRESIMEAVACDGKSTRGAAAAARTAPNHRAVMWMTTRICATPTTRRRIGSRVPSLG